MSNLNEKNTPDQMRVLMKRMREGATTPSVNETSAPKKDLDVRDMLKITRNIHEGKVSLKEDINKKTIYDQAEEEEKLDNFLRDLNVNTKFIELKVFDNLIFWGGTVDGILQFIYKVTPTEEASGVEFNYLDGFIHDNPENEELVGRIESYFDNFYRYWRDNVLDTNDNQEEEKPETATRYEKVDDVDREKDSVEIDQESDNEPDIE